MKADIQSGKIPDGTSQALIKALADVGDGVSVDELLDDNWALPDGYWLTFQSTYVHRAGWWCTDLDPMAGSMFVEFLDLAIVRYDNVPPSNWRDFLNSPSHGQYMYYVMRSKPYSLLRTKQRQVTDKMREENYRRTDF